MNRWKRVEPTIVSKVGYRTIISKTFVMPDGQTETFQTISKEGAHCIATLALTLDRQVVVAHQFRPGPEKFMDELPGGGVEPGDHDFEVAARRELLEETGYRAAAMEHLGDANKDAYQNTTWHYYFATGCTKDPHGQKLDDGEHIEVRLISIDTLFENAYHGKMTDIEAVLFAYERLKNDKPIAI